MSDDDKKIKIYTTDDNSINIDVNFDEDTVWLSQKQMGELFGRSRVAITQHIGNIFKEEELEKTMVCKEFLHTTSHGAIKNKTQTKKAAFYNLDVIISVGYRVKSKQGIQFRQWATKILKDYLIQGYAINEKLLKEKELEISELKTGMKILNRAIIASNKDSSDEMLNLFSKGLELLDNYDHEELDTNGITDNKAIYPKEKDYLELIENMYSEFKSAVFAKPKDDSFKSSINQIKQSFSGKDLYPSLEEKAATLLYLITKNHSFIDGNKRIAAACFLLFLKQNSILINKEGNKIIEDECLATLTLFIASSKSEEMDIVKKLIITVLNGNN